MSITSEPVNNGSVHSVKRKTLSDLAPGAEVCVAAVNGTGLISRRLQEMGVVPGVSVRIVKTAPFGDPLEIRLLGYNLALRRSEAQMIEVLA